MSREENSEEHLGKHFQHCSPISPPFSFYDWLSVGFVDHVSSPLLLVYKILVLWMSRYCRGTTGYFSILTKDSCVMCFWFKNRVEISLCFCRERAHDVHLNNGTKQPDKRQEKNITMILPCLLGHNRCNHHNTNQIICTVCDFINQHLLVNKNVYFFFSSYQLLDKHHGKKISRFVPAPLLWNVYLHLSI